MGRRMSARKMFCISTLHAAALPLYCITRHCRTSMNIAALPRLLRHCRASMHIAALPRLQRHCRASMHIAALPRLLRHCRAYRQPTFTCSAYCGIAAHTAALPLLPLRIHMAALPRVPIYLHKWCCYSGIAAVTCIHHSAHGVTVQCVLQQYWLKEGGLHITYMHVRVAP